ncbi:putative Rab-GTPase-TBC domain, Rhodanese-like domain, Rhodanese-like domain superfamily [Plasmopara halstedii]
MSNADFNDIFGEDPKMEELAVPTLSNIDLDDDGLFGADHSDKVSKPDSNQYCQGSNWEQIGSHEQDEFLSWLDEGGSAQPAVTALTDSLTPSSDFDPPPAPVHGYEPVTSFDCVSLDDSDDFDQILNGSNSLHMTNMSVTTMPSVSIDNGLDHFVQGAGNFTSSSVDGCISLGDDDDDDLESIVRQANKQVDVSGSRENSNSSLQIKSQLQTPQKAQIDVTAARQAYLETGELLAGSRLALWHRAVQPKNEDTASMYAVQTTSRSLPNQALLHKEVEELCSRLFSSATHARVLRELGENMRGTHLLFIDSAETLFTHLCKQFDIDYSPGMIFTFAPLLLASGCEPLHPENIEILAATCRRFLPHISKKSDSYAFASNRRPLLKRLLLYHAPRLASHLNRYFPTWNEAPAEESDNIEKSGAIPDSWLFSFFEGKEIVNDPANFEFLLKVWDCSLVLEAFSLSENNLLLTGFFITLNAIVSAEKELMRMTSEQLRHCMASTLVNTVLHGEMTKNKVFVYEVRRLIESTPSCICAKLRSFDKAPPPSSIKSVKSLEGHSTGAPQGPSNLFGVSNLFSASTQGLKDVSNLMIDVPSKLLTMVPMNPLASVSSSAINPLTDSPEVQQLFYLHAKAMDVASISVTLEAKEVISSVFGGIQGHEPGSLRYFIVDCRGPEDTKLGQVPTAFNFDPDSVSDPAVLKQVLATLCPLKHAGVHICVMGQGYAHIAGELRQFQQKQGVAAISPFTLCEGFLETYANDQTRMQSTIEFLLKHEFPHVSVIDGGYSAAHAYLFRSHSFTVDDLADHDTPNCKLCHHDRSMDTVLAHAIVGPVSSKSSEEKGNSHKDWEISLPENPSSNDESTGDVGFTDINLSSPSTSAKSTTGSYYSTFTGAFKNGSKTLLSPTMDGTKWLLKKSAATTAEFANAAANMGTIHSKSRTGSIQGVIGTSKLQTAHTKETKPTMPNLSKFRNSLVAIGSESFDMLKKVESAMEHAVEQAAVATTTTTAKVRVPFSSSPSLKEAGVADLAKSPTASTCTPLTPRGTLSADPAHGKFFKESTDEMFTIDDDDDDDDDDEDQDQEGHFVQHAEASDGNKSTPSNFANETRFNTKSIHGVVKGNVRQLKKGMTVSRTQMLPCASSPFFACYKKKAPNEKAGAQSRGTMNLRRIVVMENHLVVLKSAARNEDDIFLVKSCHSLLHITRMTCLKKNALMVTIYYRWKNENGEVVDKRNSYEVQQREDFIRAVKTTMDKMS